MDILVYTTGFTYILIIVLYALALHSKLYKTERDLMGCALISFFLLGAQLLSLAYLAWADK